MAHNIQFDDDFTKDFDFTGTKIVDEPVDLKSSGLHQGTFKSAPKRQPNEVAKSFAKEQDRQALIKKDSSVKGQEKQTGVPAKSLAKHNAAQSAPKAETAAASESSTSASNQQAIPSDYQPTDSRDAFKHAQKLFSIMYDDDSTFVDEFENAHPLIQSYVNELDLADRSEQEYVYTDLNSPQESEDTPASLDKDNSTEIF